MPSVKIFLAANYHRADQLMKLGIRLVDLGHDITSRWIWRPRELRGIRDSESQINELVNYLLDDLEDIKSCEIFLSVSEAVAPTHVHGRHVAFGVAHGLGKRLWVLGIREHALHYVPYVSHFQTLDQLLTALDPVNLICPTVVGYVSQSNGKGMQL